MQHKRNGMNASFSVTSSLGTYPHQPLALPLCHAWGDFGLAFDWRTWAWIVVHVLCCTVLTNWLTEGLTYGLLDDPLFTQTHQRQRRIQIVLMDCRSLHSSLRHSTLSLIRPIPQLLFPHAVHPGTKIKTEKKKNNKTSWRIFVFYAIFTGCDWFASCPVGCWLICKPICYIVHVSQRIVYYHHHHHMSVWATHKDQVTCLPCHCLCHPIAKLVRQLLWH